MIPERAEAERLLRGPNNTTRGHGEITAALRHIVQKKLPDYAMGQTPKRHMYWGCFTTSEEDSASGIWDMWRTATPI